MKEGFEPRLVGFLCNWCSYAGADLAGTSRIQYPHNIRVIRVMCSGAVDTVYINRALLEGADGVLVAGCHLGDCHYQNGNERAHDRAATLELLLQDMGIEPERFKLEWVSASEGQRFCDIMTEFTNTIKKLGPSPYSNRT